MSIAARRRDPPDRSKSGRVGGVGALARAIQEPAERPLILAIDGNSLIYRAYFALPTSIRDRLGRPVNAVHGFVSMLARLLRDHRPQGVVIAYDSAWPTFRHKIYPEYKANRQTLPRELLEQVPIVATLLKCAGLFNVAFDGFEGDDILASLARRCVRVRSRLLVVTGDRDLFQVVRDPLVRVLYTRRGVHDTQVLDEASVQALVGVPPARYADLAALRGDTSDNVRGVPGIGTITAAKIVLAASTLNEVYRAPTLVSQAIAARLTGSRDLVLRNQKLMRLDATVPANWGQLPLSLRTDGSEAAAAFDELGLTKAHALLSKELATLSRSQHLDGGSSESVTISNATVSAKRGRRICLIECSETKRTTPSLAADLYTSARFKLARAWSEAATPHWYILSAKHGVVAPTTRLRPYDLSLKEMTPQQNSNWGRRVLKSISRATSPDDVIISLADDSYVEPILSGLNERGHRVVLPVAGMSPEQRLQWLKQGVAAGRGVADLEEFYAILESLAEHSGGAHALAGRAARPERGVYFFFDPKEHRFARQTLRVVRVGTHAVSVNSQSTLRARLRAHYGVAAGGGNHRSSIFRSHLGVALLRREGRVSEFPHWGDQSVSPAVTEGREHEVERLVSEIIRLMRVVCVEVRDEPGPRSDRAYIERNSIALLCRIGARIDTPTSEWLGRWSPQREIRESGLWNINYVNEPTWDENFLEVFDYYARATVGQTPFAKGSVAPYGWWDRSVSRQQMKFPWDVDDTHSNRLR